MSAFETFFSSPMWAYGCGIVLCVIGVVFLVLFDVDRATKADLKKQARFYESLLREREDEIEQLKADKRRVGGELFEFRMENKMLKHQLDFANYKIEQLTKGARANGTDADGK